MPVKGSLHAVNLLSDEAHPKWKIQRYPFTDVGSETLDKMQAGYLVKFNATQDAVLPALAADDAELAGIIVGLPNPTNPDDHTVAVALSGSFNKQQIHYADAHSSR